MQEAHQTIGGSGKGRRWRVQHINDAYLVLLAAHFQSFCCDLYSEAAAAFAAGIQPGPAQIGIAAALESERQLLRGNATADNIRRDFAKFGMTFWVDVEARHPPDKARKSRLDQLNIWRNAIAHQNFKLSPENQAKVAGTDRSLRGIKSWRSCFNVLAEHFDVAVGRYSEGLVGAPPWV